MDSSPDHNSEILNELASLKKRITRIESYLDISEQASVHENDLNPIKKQTEEENRSLEFEIGQFWFAKVGILVLAIGIAIILLSIVAMFVRAFALDGDTEWLKQLLQKTCLR